MWRYAVTIVCGALVGAGIVAASYPNPPPKIARMEVVTNQYSGPVLAHDASTHEITLSQESSWHHAPATPVRFKYDDATQWKSLTYYFDGGVVVSKTSMDEASRTMPRGALVTTVLASDAAGMLRASAILFVRRIDL